MCAAYNLGVLRLAPAIMPMLLAGGRHMSSHSLALIAFNWRGFKSRSACMLTTLNHALCVTYINAVSTE